MEKKLEFRKPVRQSAKQSPISLLDEKIRWTEDKHGQYDAAYDPYSKDEWFLTQQYK